MSGLQRAMRHPDRRSSAHARARTLASDRLLAPLSREDAAWLDGHLAACAACRRMADSFAADRGRILALRDELPIPPRDLGARLSRALDVEVRRAVREDARKGRGSVVGSPSFALAGIAVAAVLAIVFLPLLIAGFGVGNRSTVPGPVGNGGPAATPMAVRSQVVSWVQREADGTYVLTSATVDRVCPGLDATSCGTLNGVAQTVVALSVQPSAVVLQHNGTSAVLVSRNALYTFNVPRDFGVTQTPAPSSLIPTPGALSPTPAVTGVGATPPAATPVPTGSTTPRPSRTPSSSSATPAASASAPRTTPRPAASALPSPSPSGDAVGTTPASEAPTPGTSIVSLPPASPNPSAAVTTPIIEGVVLVGAPPAYSTDGQWVAFSARPTDGSLGPDIYAWRVGDAKARQLTTDHASVFSAWDVDQIVGSSVLPAGSPAAAYPAVTIVVPPSPAPGSPAPGALAPGSASGEPSASASPSSSAAAAAPSKAAPSATPRGSSKPVSSGSRPHASPGGRVTPSPTPGSKLDASPSPSLDAASGATPSAGAASAPPAMPVASFLIDPATGAATRIDRPAIWRPVVDPTNRSVVFWTGDQALDPATNTWVTTSGRLVSADWQALSAGPGDVTATPLPGSAGQAGATDWDVRWDPSGRHLAVWIADATDPSIGRLSLYAVNADGTVGDALFADVAALPGLSLGSDRLAWASPPGQNGQGSTISVYAWSDTGSGSMYGAPDPGSDPIVVAR
jgi:predicted anti-sigma-YlaC factor YlaD